MFGMKPKAKAKELAVEGLNYSLERSALTLSKVIKFVGHGSDPAGEGLLRARGQAFAAQWAAVVVVLAGQENDAQLRRLALEAKRVAETGPRGDIYEALPVMSELVASVQQAAANGELVDGVHGTLVERMFEGVYPEFGSNEGKVARVGGIELGTCLRYLMHLATANKIVD